MQKIMFNGRYGLQRAAINGTKPMTRRSVPEKWQTPLTEIFEDCNYDYSAFWKQSDVQFIMYEKAPYKVGEVVAIAQSYKEAINELNRLGDISGCGKLIANTNNGCAGYYNKMFVRADLMPHRIQFTDIRVERLQDISNEDCLKEGVLQSDKYAMPFGILDAKAPNGVIFYYSTPREAFASLVDKASGRGKWDRNPWVFAYTFELVK